MRIPVTDITRWFAALRKSASGQVTIVHLTRAWLPAESSMPCNAPGNEVVVIGWVTVVKNNRSVSVPSSMNLLVALGPIAERFVQPPMDARRMQNRMIQTVAFHCPTKLVLRCSSVVKDRIIECADVPIAACEATPGCTVVEARPPCQDGQECPPEQQCVPEGAPLCGARDRDTCEMDAACELRVMQDCRPRDERRDDGQPPQDENGGFDRLVACPEVWECVPAANPPCELVPIGICDDRDDCEVRVEEVCDCGPAADEPEPDRPREAPQARRRPPPPDEPDCPCREVASCVSTNACAEIVVEMACDVADGCFWGIRPGCDCAMADPAPPCRADDPDCGPGAVPPPPPPECPPECFACLPEQQGMMGGGGEMEGVPVDPEPPLETLMLILRREPGHTAAHVFHAPFKGLLTIRQPVVTAPSGQ